MNPDEKFVHLHVHTEYSLLDGLSQIDRLVERAKELEMPSLAITDHGVMYGVVDFFRACVKEGIRPIIGMEGYLSKRGMYQKETKDDRNPYHMLLLAKNQTGYQNLLKLASRAQLEGFYRVPRIDEELMAQHSEGLVATTGCLGAKIPQAVMNGNEQIAEETIGKFQEIFGPENFYLELQYHDIDVLEQVNQWLASYRKSGHTPVQFLATNDVHYVLEEDHDPHDTLLCIQTGKLKSEANRLSMSDPSYHLTSHEEMEAIFAQKYSWLPDEMRSEALLNTAKVASMCDVDLETDGYHLPLFPVPEGYNEQSYLRYLVEKGQRWRYGDDADKPVYTERMEHELHIIHSMGFDTYFLIVWDLCEFARHADIWWNVRGSGAGSLVAYCLGITNIDPIQNSLIFERFLNPGRQTMPDIDLDYPDDRRAEMIEYSARKYGSDKVAAIITFGTMGAKNAIKDVGRALDLEVNQVADLIPQEAKVKPIEQYVDASPELQGMLQRDPKLREAIDTAKLLQGIARHASTHAAGVIIADQPLVNYIPLNRLTSGDTDGIMNQVTQFPMETCESLGLLKVDFLGLSTLTYMRRASDLIYKHHGERWTIQDIPYRPHEGDGLTEQQERENDMLAEAFELISRGETIGVFQVESPGMQDTLRGMQPWKYEHIIAAISLYRPGPMEYIPDFNDRMHGKKDIHYHHPALEPILSETYGIITYQEQIMQIASDLFSYPMSEADLMRRAVSKKKQKELIKHKAIFLERGPENGIPEETAEQIFKDIEYFANYGFNKCVVGDTQIVDAETGKLIRIDEIVQRKTVSKTATLSVENLKIETGNVIDAVFNGVKPVYRLKTRAGREITATENHPFFIFSGWKNLAELNEHDLIATPRRLPVEGQNTWEDYKLITLGHLIAEGNLCHTTGVYYYTGDEKQRDDYVKNMEMFENSVASVSKHRASYSVYSKRRKRSEPQGLVEWIKELNLWGKGAYDKFIPDEVFSLTNRCIALLIARMWEGDGHINTKMSNLYYATSSKTLAHQLQHLLLRFGIVARLYQQNFAYKDGRVGYQVHVMGHDMLLAFKKYIGKHFTDGYKRENLSRLCETISSGTGVRDVVPVDIRHVVRERRVEREMTWKQVSEKSGVATGEFSRTRSHAHRNGFQRQTIAGLAGALDCSELNKFADSDIYWDEIVSIEYVGEEPTYDLTIEDTHNFVANDIIVHNSHAADYAMITVQTAFLKTHYPEEYMAALLTVYRETADKMSTLLEECGRLGIPVLAPSVNHSTLDFDIQEDGDGTRKIRFGMAAVKNASVNEVQYIIDVRQQEGEFESLTDFCQKVDLRHVGKRTLESLAKVGAFDELTDERGPLLAALDQMTSYSADHHHAQEVGQISMFGGDDGGFDDTITLPTLKEADRPKYREKLDWEKELLGFFVTDHPVDDIMRRVDKSNVLNTSELRKLGDFTTRERRAAMIGLVTNIRDVTTRKGDAMAIVSLEDRYGTIETVFFPRTWTKYRDTVRGYVGEVVLVRGKADKRRGTVQIICDDISQDFPQFQADREHEARTNGHPNGQPAADEPTHSHHEDDDMPPPRDYNGYDSAPQPSPPVADGQPAAATAPAPPSAGQSKDNRDLMEELANDAHLKTEAEIEDRVGWWIKVYFQPDEDDTSMSKSRRRLKRIHGTFTEYPGTDKFTIVLEMGDQSYRWEFPETGTQWCEALEHRLVQIVGAENIEIFEKT